MWNIPTYIWDYSSQVRKDPLGLASSFPVGITGRPAVAGGR